MEPHAVRVEKGKAVVNLFSVPGGYVAPIMLGGGERTATIAIRALSGTSVAAEAIHPGATVPVAVAAVRRNNSWVFEVPLVRGCAMLSLKSTSK